MTVGTIRDADRFMEAADLLRELLKESGWALRNTDWEKVDDARVVLQLAADLIADAATAAGPGLPHSPGRAALGAVGTGAPPSVGVECHQGVGPPQTPAHPDGPHPI